MIPLSYILSALLILLTFVFSLVHLRSLPRPSTPVPRKPSTPTHLLIVLGSGGHTAEMLSLLTGLDPTKYTHRSYVISSGDDFSAARARDFESTLQHQGMSSSSRGVVTDVRDDSKRNGGSYTIHNIPRARRIHQSLLTTPFTILPCLVSSLLLLHHHPHGAPDLILTNGPGTSLILILAAHILRWITLPLSMLRLLRSAFRRDENHDPNNKYHQERNKRVLSRHPKTRTKPKIIYIESWARVRRPSLTGKIVVWLGLCDRVLVQWKGLEERGWGEYRGVLVR